MQTNRLQRPIIILNILTQNESDSNGFDESYEPYDGYFENIFKFVFGENAYGGGTESGTKGKQKNTHKTPEFREADSTVEDEVEVIIIYDDDEIQGDIGGDLRDIQNETALADDLPNQNQTAGVDGAPIHGDTIVEDHQEISSSSS